MTDPHLPLDDDDPVLLAGEYALGVLAPEAMRAIAARLAGDPLLRGEVARWQNDLSALADSVPEAAPPPGALGRIEARLFPEARQSLWRRLGILPALTGALVAAVLLLLVTNLGLLQGEAPVAARIAAADGSLVIAALWEADAGRLVLTPEAGAAPPGRVLELWLIAGDAAPVSLGLLSDAGATEITPAPAHAALMPGAVLAVSEEPPGGSPTGAPTGAVMATGQMATG